MNILRPLSPHLPIYKPQLTSTFSISHRISEVSKVANGSIFFFRMYSNKKKKMKTLAEIYSRTTPMHESPSLGVAEEGLSPLYNSISFPPLSPSPPNTLGIPSNSIIPAPPHSPSSSGMSSINEILSPYTERKVCEAQGRIEEEVSSIANANGITLDEEAPFVLGQWVHGESSNLNYLTSILSDLRTMKEKSQWFESATDVWSKKFFVPSPVEQFHMNPALVDFSLGLSLCWLLLVLLLLFFITKGKRRR